MEHGQFIWSETSHLVLKIRFQQYAMRIFVAQGATVLQKPSEAYSIGSSTSTFLGGQDSGSYDASMNQTLLKAIREPPDTTHR